ncbi:transporter substrate-binding domain-containing protein [Sulfurimonas sp.]|uniref:transporter substrate-binding domain-containing protein n=1 Tax=Sulfurimonas sp. TaxID=2022749 RepID=UPI002AB02873|nr:transporter substrate-binding domain-containing protein [Sulfurimonas sp.]
MKHILKVMLIAILALTTLNADTRLQKIVKKGELVLGTSGNMTPMTRSINGGKDAVGFDIDLAKTMADTMGVELVIKVIAFDKLIPALKSGKVDIVISNMTITPRRNTQVAFVGPYLTSGKCLITKKPSLASAQKEELNKAFNKMVVIKGSTSEEFIKIGMPKVQAITVESEEEAINMVRESKVAAMLTDYPVCLSVVANNPKDNFIPIPSTLSYEPIGIAIAPQNTHLLNWIQNFSVRANKMGLFEVLGKKWLGK